MSDNELLVTSPPHKHFASTIYIIGVIVNAARNCDVRPSVETLSQYDTEGFSEELREQLRRLINRMTQMQWKPMGVLLVLPMALMHGGERSYGMGKSFFKQLSRHVATRFEITAMRSDLPAM